MDFSLSDEQQVIRDLARRILDDQVTVERLQEAETGMDWFDLTVWEHLANAKLLGSWLPDEGRRGAGLLGLCLLLEEVGRAVAPVPAVSTLALGLLPIAAFGTPQQRSEFMPSIINGRAHLTAALIETGAAEPARPSTEARPDGPGWRLEGTKICVPAVHLASRILVPARTPGGTATFIVDPAAEGVIATRGNSTTGEPLFVLELRDAAVAIEDILGGSIDDGSIVRGLTERAIVALCAVQVGVTSRAVEMTAEYTTARHQFGRPLATFQAVQQRLADAYIDVEAIRLTMLQAAWKLDEGLPASEEVAVAKFWASEAGQRVASTAQHLHGGIGVDLSYPLHRYFRWAKQVELTLGAGSRHLVGLGAQMARAGRSSSG